MKIMSNNEGPKVYLIVSNTLGKLELRAWIGPLNLLYNIQSYNIETCQVGGGLEGELNLLMVEICHQFDVLDCIEGQ